MKDSKQEGVEGMDVEGGDGEEESDESEGRRVQEEGTGGNEGSVPMEDDSRDDEEEEVPKVREAKVAPISGLVKVMMHRNGCKLLLRMLAPEHTG